LYPEHDAPGHEKPTSPGVGQGTIFSKTVVRKDNRFEVRGRQASETTPENDTLVVGFFMKRWRSR
jgi:hypothetical protein